MMAMTIAPFLICDNSTAFGRRTMSTISAPLNASRATLAPAAVKSASRTPDLIPAPGSTATSAPSPIIFLTVSGVAATRGSPASVSAATATFMIPPTAARPLSGRCRYSSGSGQENRHQDQDRDDDCHHHFHQRDEIAVGLFVSGVVVARCGCVFDLAMVGHRICLQT